jgi:extracellular elastinolytic metalloproteinase
MPQATIDKRNLRYDQVHAKGGVALMEAAASKAAQDVGHALQVWPDSVNAFTGHFNDVKPSGAPALMAAHAGPPPTDGDLIHRAKSYVQSIRGAIGFAAAAPVEFEADPKVVRTSSDKRIVSLQQTVNGIEVWGMEPKVWFKPDGSVERFVGDTVSLPPSLPTEPEVAVETALLAAARAAAQAIKKTDALGETFTLPRIDIAGWTPAVTGRDTRAARTTAFDNGPFEDVAPASLVYFYMGERTRLAWRFVIAREFHAAQYLILVDAEEQADGAPEILYMRDQTSAAAQPVTAISGNVFRHNPNEGNMTRVDFPLALAEYPLQAPAGMPQGFPLPWTALANGMVATVGNNVIAVNGTTKQPYAVQPGGNQARFEPSQDTPEQYVTNIFYFCNYMHDFFMMLGFDEENGNFQQTNVSGRGRGADPVRAFAHPGQVFGIANMATRADGQAGVMNMGLFAATGRHTANDADVVFHEFCHGVSNRLVGGLHDAQGLNEDQSLSMGEGWGDFFALSIRNHGAATERVVTGSYVTNNPAGIRQKPYDDQYPGKFGDIGKGAGQVAGAPDVDYREIHNVGEIWCATLMHLLRAMTTAVGDKSRAYQLTWQAVVDGMKLTPKNPSFLAARDAILSAFAAMKGRQVTNAEAPIVQQAAWSAFAKFGMGFNASCPNATLDGCQGDGSMPPAGWED